jgi:DNA-binding LacI/PurR family transcriptional regulator
LITEIELNADGGHAATLELMTKQNRPGALIVTGDRTSLGSLEALRELKLNIPRDVALTELVKPHLRVHC